MFYKNKFNTPRQTVSPGGSYYIVSWDGADRGIEENHRYQVFKEVSMLKKCRPKCIDTIQYQLL